MVRMRGGITRRTCLFLCGSGATLAAQAAPAAERSLRGIFPIMATPFTETKAVDFADLEREVDFLERCGVHGMVWPQLASEYVTLTPEERRRGMTVLAKAARGRRAALVLGVQGANTAAALDYLKLAEDLGPDALIAIPPTEAKTVEDFRRYYAALASATRRPLFVQTSGGAPGITPPVELLVALAGEFPHLGYIKEEAAPVIPRMQALHQARPAIRRVFSGAAGKGLLYELRLGMDGTMPGAPYSDIYVRIWDAWHAGDLSAAREIFSKLLLMINLDQMTPGARQYIMKKRGVFRTTVSRRQEIRLSSPAIEEIEFCWEALRSYTKA